VTNRSSASLPVAQRKDIGEFDQDAAAGGYLYTRPGRLSSSLSNARMSQAILAAADFTAKRVIDLGCGDGAYTLELVSVGGAASAVGVDPAPAAISAATDRAKLSGVDGCSFRVGNIYSIDPRIENYDIAVLRGVLHHTDDPEKALAVALALAPFAIVLEPNGSNPVLKLIERLSPYHRAHGERSFLPSTIRRWARRTGGRAGLQRAINLVPMFCPDWLARFCKVIEPTVEALPLLRNFTCAQYVFRFER
jgi:SAM-dependent methyltransferase